MVLLLRRLFLCGAQSLISAFYSLSFRKGSSLPRQSVRAVATEYAIRPSSWAQTFRFGLASVSCLLSSRYLFIRAIEVALLLHRLDKPPNLCLDIDFHASTLARKRRL